MEKCYEKFNKTQVNECNERPIFLFKSELTTNSIQLLLIRVCSCLQYQKSECNVVSVFFLSVETERCLIYIIVPLTLLPTQNVTNIVSWQFFQGCYLFDKEV